MDVVSGIPDVSDFINDGPANVFFKRLGTLVFVVCIVRQET